MAESFAEQLSEFTPHGSGLDRDALLFAAGRASVRPNRTWATLACTLAASQALTLVLFWPKASAPVEIVREVRPLASVREDFLPAPAGVETELRALSGRAFVGDGDIPRFSAAVQSMVPESPPLHAFGGSF